MCTMAGALSATQPSACGKLETSTTTVFAFAAITFCASDTWTGSSAMNLRSTASRPSYIDAQTPQAVVFGSGGAGPQVGSLPTARMVRSAPVAAVTAAASLASVGVTMVTPVSFARTPSTTVVL